MSYVTVVEAAKIKNVTRQAIYLAIKLKKLKAYKHGTKLKVFLLDLKDYDASKYSRLKAMHEGKLIFDESKGHISIERAAEMTGIPKQKIYYAARTGRLKAFRKRNAWVIHKEDLIEFQEEFNMKHLSKAEAQ